MVTVQELSNDDLLRRLGRTAPGAPSVPSVSQLSDQDLLQRLGRKPKSLAQQPEQPGFIRRGLETAADVGTAALTGLAELPLGAQQLATDIAATRGGEQAPAGRVGQVLGFLADPAAFIQDPELRAELGRTDVGALRKAQASAAQRIEDIQKEAAKTSPIAAPVGEFAGQALQVAGLLPGAIPATAKGAAGAGILTGGAFSGLQPETQQLTTEEAIAARQQRLAIGAGLGGVLGAGVQQVIQQAPALAGKLGDLLPKIPGFIGRGIARLAKVNPQAAQDFAETNNIASLGALSDSPVVKLAEATLEKFPLASDIMEKNASRVIANIESNIDTLGGAKGVSNTEAGEIIQGGVRKFVEKFSAVSEKLYNRLDKFVSKEESVSSTNINNLFQQISKEQAATPALQARIQNSEGFKVLNDIASDANLANGQLPYKALKRYRTLIGNKLNKPQLIDSEEEAILDRAYGALTDDMRTIFQAKGDDALRAFDKTNDFYRQGRDRIKNSLQKVINQEAPEKVLRAALEGTKLGGTRIGRIMRSLDKQEREIVTGTVLKNLGKANPGAQDATGDLFSVNTFLTNMNKLSPEAKTALFGDKSNLTRRSIDVIASQASRLRDINRFRNPSGTAQQVTLGAVLMGLFTAPAATIGTVASANGLARLFTNESFIRFLGKSVNKQINPGNISKSLKALENVAKNNPGIANDISKYVASLAILNEAKNGIIEGDAGI